jgi:hypothetical protein
MATTFAWNGTTYSVPASGELNWASLSSFLIALGAGAQTTTLQKWGMRVATASPVTVAAATDCIVVTKLSVAGAVAVNLPAGATKQIFCIVDGTGDAATNNITITPNGAETINGASTLVLNSNREGVIIAYSGTEWLVLAKFKAAGTITDADVSASAAIAWTKISKSGSNLTDIATRSHTSLTDIGTNTHAQIDTAVTNSTNHIASTLNPHSVTKAQVLAAELIVNADVKSDAAIAYSKLNLGTSIVNADISASAAIVDTKLDTISTALKVSNSATTATSANTASAIVARDGSGNFTAGTITANLTGNASGTAANVTGTVAIANGGTGQTTANTALNALLPAQAGNANKVLSTNATDTSWIAVATTVTTTRGDLIRRGASADERFAAVTDNRVVRGDGTDVISGQIDDPDFFTTGAAASASAIGIVTTSDQSFAGVKTFETGVLSRSSFGGFASSGTAQTLAADSPEYVLLASPASAINQDLPTTNVKRGRKFVIQVTGATATNTVTVRSSGGNTIQVYRGHGRCVVVALQDTPTTAGHWGLVEDEDRYTYVPTFYKNDGTTTIATSSSSIVMHRIGKMVAFWGRWVQGAACDSNTYMTILETGNWAAGTGADAYRGKGTSYGDVVAAVKPITSIYYNTRLNFSTSASDNNYILNGSFDIQ